MTKKNIWAATLCAASLLSGCSNNTTNKNASEEYYLLIGSYAPASEEGIKIYTFDQNNGKSEYVNGLKGISNPSYLTPSSDGTRVYSVAEDEGETASLYALSFDKEKGTLSLLNAERTQGGAPCYVALSPDENYAVTANYLGGSISLFPIGQNGKLGTAQPIVFSGKGTDPERQKQPHLHCIQFTPDKHYLLASDLGTDRIYSFPLNVSEGLIDTSARKDILLPPASGPRHLTPSPDGKHIYLMTELSGEVVVLSYDEAQLDTMQTVLADTCHAQGGADIHVSPDGYFVYASCRLQNDGIAIFEVSEDGSLTKTGYQNTSAHPRNFILSPNGNYLLVACRDANTVEIYQRDPETGLLQDTGKRIEMSKPVCLKFIKR